MKAVKWKKKKPTTHFLDFLRVQGKCRGEPSDSVQMSPHCSGPRLLQQGAILDHRHLHLWPSPYSLAGIPTNGLPQTERSVPGQVQAGSSLSRQRLDSRVQEPACLLLAELQVLLSDKKISACDSLLSWLCIQVTGKASVSHGDFLQDLRPTV